MAKNVICFGEVLWDIFPEGEKIGGAPLNVALRLNSLGILTNIVSRVGKDSLGKRLTDYLQEKGLSTSYLQEDHTFETGKVLVSLDATGSASYEIAQPVAWDNITCTPSLEKVVEDSDVFLYGSLIARELVARESLMKLLKKASFKVFDVNLRAPHYTQSLLEELMQEADFIKFNDEELLEISTAMGCKNTTLEGQLRFIASHTQTTQICVTKGGDGALLLLDDYIYDQAGFRVKVADTVGAGDSFLATLLEGILTKRPPNEALKRACAMGALVASKQGANPSITDEELDQFISTTSK